MKRPKATIEPLFKGKSTANLYRLLIGDFPQANTLQYDTARHLAACWNACRDIETEELETLATAGILVEKGLVESPERAFLKRLYARLYPSILEDNAQTRLDRDLEKELEKLLELEQV